MIGVIANTISVLLGSTIGLIAKKAIPDSWGDTILKGMGLSTLILPISLCNESVLHGAFLPPFIERPHALS